MTEDLSPLFLRLRTIFSQMTFDVRWGAMGSIGMQDIKEIEDWYERQRAAEQSKEG